MASQYMAYKPSPIHKPLEISNLGHISLLETPFLLEIVFITQPYIQTHPSWSIHDLSYADISIAA